jgi:hypothetical protein
VQIEKTKTVADRFGEINKTEMEVLLKNSV